LLDDAGLAGTYNFAYLPLNFKDLSSCYGYAFVHFVSGEAALSAWSCLEQFETLDLAWSERQGLTAHVERLRNSSVMHASVPEDAKPLLLQDGAHIAFPSPTQRLPHPRSIRGRHTSHVKSSDGERH